MSVYKGKNVKISSRPLKVWLYEQQDIEDFLKIITQIFKTVVFIVNRLYICGYFKFVHYIYA